MALPAGEETRRIFEPLYRVPPALRAPYCQLKAQELLLLLDRLDPAQTGVLEQYGAGQAELVQRIHDQLTAHPDRRVTIEELSRQYLINTSSLKAVFKAVYGQPIAAYMKEYRVRLGAGLLRSTDLSVAQVARRVGYESQASSPGPSRTCWGSCPASTAAGGRRREGVSRAPPPGAASLLRKRGRHVTIPLTQRAAAPSASPCNMRRCAQA